MTDAVVIPCCGNSYCDDCKYFTWMLKKRSISRLVESCKLSLNYIYICGGVFTFWLDLKVFILLNIQQLFRDKSTVEIAEIPIYPKLASLERCSLRACCILSSWWISPFSMVENFSCCYDPQCIGVISRLLGYCWKLSLKCSSKVYADQTSYFHQIHHGRHS